MLTGFRLDYLIIYVRDLSESQTFYCGALGLQLKRKTHDLVEIEAGQVVLRLRRASDHNVTLYGRRDDSSDVVFLVEDLESVRLALESRGVTFVRRRSYEVGLVTDFYDPNGHRLMLYQPSPTALTWPSADKIREVWRNSGRGGSALIGPAAELSIVPDRVRGLMGKPLIYLFMFENEQGAAFDFYSGQLGLPLLERVHCCNQECAEEVEGIAKYDGGGVLLSTHHVHQSSVVVDDEGQVYSPTRFDPAHCQGIAPVFVVDDLRRVAGSLSASGIRVSQSEHRPEGTYARFEDPFGHPFFILEPACLRQRKPAHRHEAGIQGLGKVR